MKKVDKKEDFFELLKNVSSDNDRNITEFNQIIKRYEDLIKRGVTYRRGNNLLSKELLNSPTLNFNSNL